MNNEKEYSKAQTQTELEALVARYLELRDQNEALALKARTLTPLELPSTAQTLEQLESYREQSDQHNKLIVETREEIKKLTSEVHSVIQAIKYSLPVSGVWVKVGEYAVGKHWDVWGGGHYELDIRQWSDDLPKLKDRNFYP